MSPATTEGCLGLGELDAFADAVAAIGTARFDSALLAALRGVAAVDHLTLLTYRAEEGLRTLGVSSATSLSVARSLTRDYVAQHHVHDPNFAELQRRTRSRRIVVRRHDFSRLRHKAYQARFYTTVGIVDKISFLWRSGVDAFYLNLYRTVRSGRYSMQEVRELSSLARLVVSLVRLHAGRLDLASALSGERGTGLVHRLVDLLHPGLTKRERSVLSRILTGMPTEGIALELGIFPSSVITFRRRAYVKLGIATQAELFACCLRVLPGLGT